ncbi:UrcA family protein [Sphingomonas psychrotolerans]|uniref:UrcA family protein n=1 Tax=Sphingomonas psychrotolerans TaxID=1327635 RepID=A0A2K8MR55_9SPHN|nr:UrcA family protein [Sphingomonas psychrotolerans]ATY34499.1 UrcA family protein [Sphingomonas psychrotolerans]
MKILALFPLLGAAACVSPGYVDRPVPVMAVAYHDLQLQTGKGRTELAMRVAQSAADFCQSYDPQDQRMIFDVRLASARNCPGAARLMLLQRMPNRVRRAYHAARNGK